MAFQMIHMEVAYRLIEPLLIKYPAEFILGSVAPDSVHMSKDYRVEDKIHSHLFEGCGPWGDTRDYDRWLANIKAYYQSKKAPEASPEQDFIKGIIVHCLTDYCNDLDIWRKLQKPYLSQMTLEEFRSIFNPEAFGIDQWLFHTSEHSTECLKLLEEGQAFSLDFPLSLENIETERHHLSKEQYATKLPDISTFKLISGEFLLAFLDSTVVFIKDRFKDYE